MKLPNWPLHWTRALFEDGLIGYGWGNSEGDYPHLFNLCYLPKDREVAQAMTGYDGWLLVQYSTKEDQYFLFVKQDPDAHFYPNIMGEARVKDYIPPEEISLPIAEKLITFAVLAKEGAPRKDRHGSP